MKKIYKKIGITLLCINLVPIELFSFDDRLRLPGNINGIELLGAGGIAHDDTAFLGEKKSTEFSPFFALMTEDFYVDIHKIAYRFHPKEDTILTLIGRQDALPNEEDIPSYLNIKSGESYDVGLMAEKKFGKYSLEAEAMVDVTGTHNGVSLELAMGYNHYSEKSHFEVVLGARYQDNNRANYLYGVSSKEANSSLKKYEAKGDLAAFLYASYVFEVYNNLGLVLQGSITSLSDTAKQSPRIKNDAKYQEVELFAGLVWQFSIYDKD